MALVMMNVRVNRRGSAAAGSRVVVEKAHLRAVVIDSWNYVLDQSANEIQIRPSNDTTLKSVVYDLEDMVKNRVRVVINLDADVDIFADGKRALCLKQCNEAACVKLVCAKGTALLYEVQGETTVTVARVGPEPIGLITTIPT